jgi:hypothetical protein
MCNVLVVKVCQRSKHLVNGQLVDARVHVNHIHFSRASCRMQDSVGEGTKRKLWSQRDTNNHHILESLESGSSIRSWQTFVRTYATIPENTPWLNAGRSVPPGVTTREGGDECRWNSRPESFIRVKTMPQHDERAQGTYGWCLACFMRRAEEEENLDNVLVVQEHQKIKLRIL